MYTSVVMQCALCTLQFGALCSMHCGALCTVHYAASYARCRPTGVGSGSDRRRFRCSYLTRPLCYDEDAVQVMSKVTGNADAGDEANVTPDLASQSVQACGNHVQVDNQSDQLARQCEYNVPA